MQKNYELKILRNFVKKKRNFLYVSSALLRPFLVCERQRVQLWRNWLRVVPRNIIYCRGSVIVLDSWSNFSSRLFQIYTLSRIFHVYEFHEFLNLHKIHNFSFLRRINSNGTGVVQIGPMNWDNWFHIEIFILPPWKYMLFI